MTVMTKNSTITESPKSTTSAKKKLQSIMMVTLTKLLDIRIVASKRSESFSKLAICLSEGCSSSSISLRSPGEREKNAISEADTKPDANNNNTAKMMATIAPNEGAVTVTPSKRSAKWHKYESGSKECNLN